MTLEKYLNKKYSSGTAKTYQRDIAHYLARNPKAKTANYADILNYLESLRSTQSPASIHRILQSIKKYYYYLLTTDQREDHPCEGMQIKDHRRNQIQHQDLLKPEDLQQLFSQLKSRYKILYHRNKLIISLLIYQALTTSELVQLKIKNIDVEQGTIYIPRSHRLNARTLELRAVQLDHAYHYICIDRKQLIKVSSDQLLITKTGQAENGEGISYLVSTLRRLIRNNRVTPQLIRQSVITNLLHQGTSLRTVQLFAGHKNPSSTERYRQTNLEGLRQAISRYHPLG